MASFGSINSSPTSSDFVYFYQCKERETERERMRERERKRERGREREEREGERVSDKLYYSL
jgi:hypothetical protein